MTMRLLDLIGRDVALRRVASTRGGEYVGPCPFCGMGNDRFHVWPDAERPGYWCRQCGKKGDAIQYLRDHDGLSYRQACEYLGIAPGERRQPLTLTERLLRPVQRSRTQEAAPAQQAQLAMLQALEPRLRAALVQSEQARAYLAARRIPLDVARGAGVGFLPRTASFLKWYERLTLQKWLDRLIFPLSSPAGRGYAGRSLARWHPGMDENAHKARLEAPGAPRRWEKTNPAGWYGLAELSPDLEQLIIVEGPFDRLALIAAGIAPDAILALVGSRDSRAAEWIPAHVKRVIIALDGDESGKIAAEALADELYPAGLACVICTPPDDGQGKDWSERLRLGGKAALWPVLAAFSPAPAEATTPEGLVPWRPEWEGLDRRQRLYRMAEALRFPALQVGGQQIDAGDRVAWDNLAEGAADLAALAYDLLVPRFQR